MGKPVRVELDFMPLLLAQFANLKTLTKDLTDGEVICRSCNGIGIFASDSPYALREPGAPPFGFPYNHQHLHPCPLCYDGIQKLCPFCQTPFRKGYTGGCLCYGSRAAQAAEDAEKEAERLKSCKHVAFADYDGEFLYDDNDARYVQHDDELDPAHTYFACNPSAMAILPTAEDVIDQILDAAAQECDEGEEQVTIKPGGKEILDALLGKWFSEYVDSGEVYWMDKDVIVDVLPADISDE